MRSGMVSTKLLLKLLGCPWAYQGGNYRAAERPGNMDVRVWTVLGDQNLESESPPHHPNYPTPDLMLRFDASSPVGYREAVTPHSGPTLRKFYQLRGCPRSPFLLTLGEISLQRPIPRKTSDTKAVQSKDWYVPVGTVGPSGQRP